MQTLPFMARIIAVQGPNGKGAPQGEAEKLLFEVIASQCVQVSRARLRKGQPLPSHCNI